jgi:hypothetical protein
MRAPTARPPITPAAIAPPWRASAGCGATTAASKDRGGRESSECSGLGHGAPSFGSLGHMRSTGLALVSCTFSPGTNNRYQAKFPFFA